MLNDLKLSNSEQSYKGKVKTHKYINRTSQRLVFVYKVVEGLVPAIYIVAFED
jgi:hypothetical protein